jgi:hypothetical protein
MGKKREYTIVIYIIFALYLINKAFSLIEIPEAVLNFERWILVVAAVLLLWGGYRSMKLKQKEGEFDI